jgi:phosphoribosylamine---glycine ligase
VPLAPAQDFKRIGDGETGPNTGGMGAYSPVPFASADLVDELMAKAVAPTLGTLANRGIEYRGVLYAGLMLTPEGMKVLEYNVRFGDPECQPLLMRLKSDLVDLLEATVDGRLDEASPPEWDPRPAVCVVMASEGYPANYERGQPVRGLDEAAKVADVKVFHAGTALRDGQVVTDGGRVLGVTALGTSISAAKLQAYTAVKCIRFSGAWCRKDISDKALTYK